MRIAMLVCWGAFAVTAPALADVPPYSDPTVVTAGSAKRMARAAQSAVECGIDLVTVRPWKDGDTPGFTPTGSRPMSLIIQILPESDLNKVLACFHEKMGWAGIIVA